MTIQKIREKCRYFGLSYCGKWDNKHWAFKPDEEGRFWGSGTQYELTEDFFKLI